MCGTHLLMLAERIDLRARTLHASGMNRDPRSVFPSLRPDPFHSHGLILSLLFAVLCLPAMAAPSLDWPEFRGPWGNGQTAAPGDSKQIGLPLHWSETE